MTDPNSEPNTVPELLRSRAEQSPDSVAYSYEDDGGWRTITWRDFYRRTRALAMALRGKGLEPGDHVGMLAPTGLGWELFHHAILTAGGVVVGLEPHDVADRLQWIADHAELRMVVVQDEKLLEKLSKQQIQKYRAVILLAGERPQGMEGGNFELWPKIEATAEPNPTLPDVEPNASATLIYTSGTTGQPKGILYRHEQVALAVRAITRAYPSIQVGARFICWLPLSNLFQRIMNLAAVKVGGTVYLVGNPLDVMRALPVARPDVFIGVPRFYEKLHEGINKEIAAKASWLRKLITESMALGDRVAGERRKGQHSSLALRLLYRAADALVLQKLRSAMGGRIQFMITGSAPTPLGILKFFDAIGLPLYEAYGLSENIVPMALNRPGQSRFGTVGKPLEENDLQLDEDGELLVKGPGVFPGYYRDDRRDMFTQSGHYRTGDYAVLEPDGYLSLHGRKSEIIKTSTGRRISPIGIEAKLQESPYVDRAVVVGEGRKCLIAILSIKDTLFAECNESEDTLALPLTPPPEDVLRASAARLTLSLAPLSSSLAETERPAGFIALCRPFSIDAGELTPNLKLRRSHIMLTLATTIDNAYDHVEKTTPGESRIVFAK